MVGEEEKARVKAGFTSWLEVQDRKAELSAEAKAVVGDCARLLNVKPTVVSKMFSFLKKRHDTATDELGELTDLVEEVFED